MILQLALQAGTMLDRRALAQEEWACSQRLGHRIRIQGLIGRRDNTEL